MSQPTDNHDELDPRLRDYYTRHLPTPPTPDALWQQVRAALHTKGELNMSTKTPDPTPHSSPASGRRPRRIFSGIGAVAAVILVVVLALTVFANHPHMNTTPAAKTTPATSTSQSPTPLPTTSGTTQSTQDNLRGISMDSPNDGWAVGSHTSITTHGVDESGTSSTLLYHFSNGTWQPVAVGFPPPGPIGDVSLDAVSMVSANDGWSVGQEVVGTGANTRQRALLLHYDGTQWTPYSIDLPAELVDVQMISSDEGWAVSGSTPAANTHPVILHYRNGAWGVQYTLPTASDNGNGILYKLAMVSADEGWAVGTTYVQQGTKGAIPSAVFLHYQHGTWSVQQSFPNVSLNAISMDSASDGWAVGLSGDVSSTVYHYQGGVWHAVPGALAQPGPKGQTSIDGVTLHMNSATDGWLGDGIDATHRYNDYLYHFDGTGWHLVTVTTNLYGASVGAITFLPDGEGWAAGSGGESSYPDENMRALILHYSNGTWSTQLG